MSEEAVQEPQQINIAEMMAKDGIKTDDSPIISIPAQNATTAPAQPVETPTPQEPVVAETVTTTPGQAAPPETPKPETPKPDPAATPVAGPPERVPAQVQPTEPDWRELLKKQPEVEVLKAVGLDEKMINFLSKWKGGEDLKDYLQAVTVDYSKMGPEELLRQHLKAQFGSLSAEDFEEVYKMKVIEQYKLDPDVFTETEVRRGKLLLGIDADNIRQDLTKRQQELLFAKAPEPGPTTADVEAQAKAEQREKDYQAYKGLVDTNQYTKELINTKLLKVGDGDKAFNLEVTNPNEVLDLLYDPAKWAQKLWNEDGTPNVRKQLILGAIANDDTLFFSNLAKHYERLGAENIASKIQNASEPSAGTPSKGSTEALDFVSQLARFGSVTSGD